VDLSVLSQLGGHSAKRTHRNKSGPNIGFAIISTLQKEIATRANIEIITGAKAHKLLLADEAQTPATVTGVELKLADGQTLSVYSKAVLLTTGGFSASHKMLKRFAPGMETYPTTNGVWAQGEGVLMSEAIGVDLTLMDKVQLHPTGFINPKDREAGTRFLAPEAIRGSGAVLLNKNGERFIDELTTRDKASAAMLAQPGQEAFMLLFEDGAKAMASELPFYKHMGIVTMTNSVEEAAKFCNFDDPHALLKELNDYADVAAGAKADPFGKKTFPYPIQRIASVDTPMQIVAMEVAPTVHYTMGASRSLPLVALWSLALTERRVCRRRQDHGEDGGPPQERRDRAGSVRGRGGLGRSARRQPPRWQLARGVRGVRPRRSPAGREHATSVTLNLCCMLLPVRRRGKRPPRRLNARTAVLCPVMQVLRRPGFKLRQRVEGGSTACCHRRSVSIRPETNQCCPTTPASCASVPAVSTVRGNATPTLDDGRYLKALQEWIPAARTPRGMATARRGPRRKVRSR